MQVVGQACSSVKHLVGSVTAHAEVPALGTTLKLEVVSPVTASDSTSRRMTFCSLVTAPVLASYAMYGANRRPMGLHYILHQAMQPLGGLMN